MGAGWEGAGWEGAGVGGEVGEGSAPAALAGDKLAAHPVDV